MPRDPEHPVWEVYNLLRTARLNVYYYTVKIDGLKAKEKWINILLAITVPTSSVASLAIWNYPWLQIVWGIVVAISAFVAIVSPFMNLADRIQKHEALITRYRIIAGELETLRASISQKESYDEQMIERFLLIQNNVQAAVALEPTESADIKLSKEMEDRIKRQLPKDSFYLPPRDHG